MAAAATLRGTGSSVPKQLITNRDEERIVDTSDEWIVSHTGMRERRIAGPEQATSDLATVAAQRALADADLTPADIDFVICTTITPDMAFPATACIVQANLGIKAPAFDLTNGCTGFIYGLTVADSFVRAGAYRNVLVISADCLTRITNWTDRSTCVLFGDAAGAAVVSPCEAGYGVLAHELGSLGELGDLLLIPAGGSRVRLTPRLLEQNMETMSMTAGAIQGAVRMVPEPGRAGGSASGSANVRRGPGRQCTRPTSGLWMRAARPSGPAERRVYSIMRSTGTARPPPCHWLWTWPITRAG